MMSRLFASKACMATGPPVIRMISNSKLCFFRMPASLAKAKATFSVLVAAVLATRTLVGWAKTDGSINNETRSEHAIRVRLGADMESFLQYVYARYARRTAKRKAGVQWVVGFWSYGYGWKRFLAPLEMTV